MNPAIVAPDGFDVVDVLAGGQLQAEQRRNLGSVAKVLQFAAAGKLFDGESSHMASMNDYLLSAHQKFRYSTASCRSKLVHFRGDKINLFH